jgi:phosphate transport system permease protein
VNPDRLFREQTQPGERPARTPGRTELQGSTQADEPWSGRPAFLFKQCGKNRTMQFSVIILVLLAIMAVAYHLGRKRSLAVAGGRQNARVLHSLPSYYGFYTAIWAGLPALFVFGAWIAFQDNVVTGLVVSGLPAETQALPPNELNLVVNDIRNLAGGNIVSRGVDPQMQAAADRYNSLRQTGALSLFAAVLALGAMGIGLAWRLISPRLRARNQVESVLRWVMIGCSTIAIFTTIGIVLSVLFESTRFFGKIPVTDFLFGLEWSPQTAIRADQVGSSGSFGAIPLFAGTLLISFIAMLVAVPIGLMSALYLSEYASRKVRAAAKPVLEILAGIPTVVYGFFAALVVAPTVRDFGASLGLDVSSESALAAGLVMGIMIIPFVSSLSDDVINAVPQTMRDGSYALGATRSETITKVIFPAALPGIVGGILLAVSRAIGETMIVVMAAGLSANLTANPLQAVTTVTVQIVTLLTGDQEFDSPKTLAAFALGLMLFVVTLVLNVVALYVVRKYREQYE